MPAEDVHPDRIRTLNDADPRGGEYVLYWMQQSQRAEDNPALEYAVQQANEAGKRLLVAFGLMDDYPGANARHYAFLIRGLADVEAALKKRGIGFAVQRGAPDEVAVRLARDAVTVVCDRGYLRHQKAWRRNLARKARCRVVQVEGDVVVPVEAASGKAEYAARTIRPRITRQLDRYLVEPAATKLKKSSLDLSVGSIDVSSPGARRDLLEALAVDRSVPPVDRLFTGGSAAARRALDDFLKRSFKSYDEHRNQPQTDDVSHMSMYLHFGHISPLRIALEVRRSRSRKNRETFLEELIVRRELACNYVNFTSDYDRFSALPRWARATLEKHAGDERPHRYTRRQLEDARTHDPYWNAAMREMRHTGYMHNYMRMYWGKKILEWTGTPRHAYQTALELNNRYFLDGRDPNSFANVAWLFGLHDRPWTERDVYGTVRCMTAGGLERKCDPAAYVAKVDELVAAV